MKVILTINSGSSSIKFSVFSIDHNAIHKLYVGIVDNVIQSPLIKIKNLETDEKTEHVLAKEKKDPYENAVGAILGWLKKRDLEVVACGHRAILGGEKYPQPVPITPDVLSALDHLSAIFPLHQPFQLKGIQIIEDNFKDIFQAVCFDSSFHTTYNELTKLFAIPKAMTKEGIIRYGYHGLSYEYVVSQFDQYFPEKANGKIVVCHLGAGASLCAIDNKKSVAGSLGFSGLDGIPMATRCGNIDAGVLFYLMSYKNMSHQELEKVLYKESGLLGVSGVSHDMRDLESSDSEDAKKAIDLFCYRINAWIGMLAAEMGGLDGIVFTAGIGENSVLVREKVCHLAKWLGAEIDIEKNNQNANDIAHQNSKLVLHVIPTDEELMIAQHTFRLLDN